MMLSKILQTILVYTKFQGHSMAYGRGKEIIRHYKDQGNIGGSFTRNSLFFAGP